MPGYPRPLSDWGMKTTSGALVDKVDAAFIWAHNGKTYLFSGREFWRFDESRKDGQMSSRPDSGYPRNIDLWEGMPPEVDDIITLEGGDIELRATNM